MKRGCCRTWTSGREVYNTYVCKLRAWFVCVAGFASYSTIFHFREPRGGRRDMFISALKQTRNTCRASSLVFHGALFSTLKEQDAVGHEPRGGNTRVCIYVYLSISLSLYIYIYIHTNTCTSMYACVYMYMCVYIYIYIYIYTHTRKMCKLISNAS